jgi:hypothetical protein
MKENIWKISFEEMSLKGKIILQQQPEVTFEQAKAQVKWLKENSIISSQLKKHRKE